MKLPRCFLLALLALVSGTAVFAAASPRPERVVFDRQTLSLVTEGENLKEYLHASETKEKWTRFASIRIEPELDDPAELAATMMARLAQENPQARAETLADPKSGEHTVAYLTWAPDQSHVEFNVYRITRRTEGGLSVQQYSVRDYDNILEFVKNLKPLKDRLVRQMTRTGLKTRN